MKIKPESQFNPEEFGSEGSKTPEGGTEKKEYELFRFGAGLKALGAFNIAILSNYRLSLFASDEEWKKREKETRMPLLKNFTKKAIQSYQALEKAGEVIDEGIFREISAGYEERMNDATTEEERRAIIKEFEDIKRSRDKKLAQETIRKNVRSTVFGMFEEILKK